MKTPEQIKAWLEAQPWYEQFKKNVEIHHYPFDINNFLKRKYGDFTIVRAFSWQYSNEGFEYWRGIDMEFTKWYNHDEENPD